jgi:hypothetical protein
MRYFMLASDGQTYGPVDVATLRQWATEGRLLPDSMLHEEGTGVMLRAKDLISFAPLQASPAPFSGTVPGILCQNCGIALPLNAKLCGRCGARPLASFERKLTGLTSVDVLLGILTVGAICAVTVLLFTWQVPFGGFTAMLPIVAPIMLYAALMRTYRAYSNGLIAGCCLLPVGLIAIVVTGIYNLAHTPWALPTSQWKCF